MDVFSFRRLRVYRLAMALVRYVYQATRMMPTDARAIVWQLLRASSSVALNIAEGCGEYSPKEKARFFRIARRSSWEAVAALDLLVLLGFLEQAKRMRAEAAYAEVGAMLTSLAKKYEAGGSAMPPIQKFTRRKSGGNPTPGDRRAVDSDASSQQAMDDRQP